MLPVAAAASINSSGRRRRRRRELPPRRQRSVRDGRLVSTPPCWSVCRYQSGTAAAARRRQQRTSITRHSNGLQIVMLDAAPPPPLEYAISARARQVVMIKLPVTVPPQELQSVAAGCLVGLSPPLSVGYAAACAAWSCSTAGAQQINCRQQAQAPPPRACYAANVGD